MKSTKVGFNKLIIILLLMFNCELNINNDENLITTIFLLVYV